MKVTIVRDDGLVGVDGLFRKVSMVTLPAGVRAVQYQTETGGHVEHDDAANTALEPGQFSEFQPFVDLWAAAAPPPEVGPTFAALKAAEIALYIETREKMCARVAGIGQRLARAGDTAGAASCDAVVNALLDVPAHASVTGATDLASLQAALKTRYVAAVSLASASARTEFKRYDK